MRLIRNNSDFLTKKTVVTIGSFDGVHLGHRRLLQEVELTAKRYDLLSALVSFYNHPVEFFSNKRGYSIYPFRSKFELIAKAKIDYMYLVKFDHDFMSMSYIDFIKEILVKCLNTKHIVVGEDFRFGKNREGDFSKCKHELDSYGISLKQLSKIEGFSSTHVRNALKNGNITEANHMLGEKYFNRGRVLRGAGRGRTIGFPTANVSLPSNICYPRLGVYAVIVHMHDNRKLRAILNIGVRPTFHIDNKISQEVHIFDFNEDIYGQILKIEFIDFIRAEKKFDGIEAIKKQISTDVVKAKEILSNVCL